VRGVKQLARFRACHRANLTKSHPPSAVEWWSIVLADRGALRDGVPPPNRGTWLS
jgi:hypothetical protein